MNIQDIVNRLQRYSKTRSKTQAHVTQRLEHNRQLEADMRDLKEFVNIQETHND